MAGNEQDNAAVLKAVQDFLDDWARYDEAAMLGLVMSAVAAYSLPTG